MVLVFTVISTAQRWSQCQLSALLENTMGARWRLLLRCSDIKTPLLFKAALSGNIRISADVPCCAASRLESKRRHYNNLLSSEQLCFLDCAVISANQTPTVYQCHPALPLTLNGAVVKHEILPHKGLISQTSGPKSSRRVRLKAHGEFKGFNDVWP